LIQAYYFFHICLQFDVMPNQAPDLTADSAFSSAIAGYGCWLRVAHVSRQAYLRCNSG
jgi:hypothetical protein